jgi:hypothetical protein
VVLGYEWSFGAERLGTVWAPYAIALPAALLVLLVADIVASPDPWPSAIAAAVCATFLCQTDISTVVVVGALAVATPLLRLASGARLRRRGDGRRTPGPLWSFQPGWGWATGKWRRSLAVLAAVVVVLWLPPLIQQLTTSPGNFVRVYRFLSSHPSRQPWLTSLRAAGTVFGSFPLRLGEKVARRDADPAWLVAQSLGRRPWYLVYLVVTVAAAAYGFTRRERAAVALAGATTVAMLAAGWSVHLAYGPLYPYLVLWTGALVVPALTAWWLVLARLASGRAGPPSGRASAAPWPAWLRPLDRLVAPPGWARLVGTSQRAGLGLPVLGLAMAVAVGCAFAVTAEPMAGNPSHLARRSWEAVSAAALAPGVKTLYVDIVDAAAMPDAAAIADQAVREGLRVEVNAGALHYLDPSFAPRSVAQLKIVVCCGRRAPDKRPAGTELRGKVGGERIFISTAGYIPRRAEREGGAGG